MVDTAEPAYSDYVRAPSDEQRLLQALRAGDEMAFVALVERYQGTMLRLAAIYTTDHEIAADVVQEVWIGVLRGLDRFEGRSSLKTWIFRILTNCAKTRAQREGHSIPFSALWDPDADPDEPAVAADRFQTPAGRFPGGWVTFPSSWQTIPEELWLSRETRLVIEQAIAALPPSQREVITLRDIEGWTSDEVCNVLGLTETNQRVLLHRARAKVRRALEQYLDVEKGRQLA
jgi:RNA polymerase sigma-70 factor, ECF subfamily